jgi:hypothetical protein
MATVDVPRASSAIPGQPSPRGESPPATAASTAATPLLRELEATPISYLHPAAFFVSWHGVLTLAFRGFTPALVDLKARVAQTCPALPPESPGSLWPKASLACLEDGATLTREQYNQLNALCK